MQEKMSTIRKKINRASGAEPTEKHVGPGLKICATRGRPGGASKKPMVAPDDCFLPYDTRKVVLVAMSRHAEPSQRLRKFRNGGRGMDNCARVSMGLLYGSSYFDGVHCASELSISKGHPKAGGGLDRSRTCSGRR